MAIIVVREEDRKQALVIQEAGITLTLEQSNLILGGGFAGVTQQNLTDTLADLTASLQASINTKSNESTRAQSGKGFVSHGAVATVARPTGYASVEWTGSVVPVNAIDGDTWINTAA